jgi:hypothetical protein
MISADASTNSALAAGYQPARRNSAADGSMP